MGGCGLRTVRHGRRRISAEALRRSRRSLRARRRAGADMVWKDSGKGAGRKRSRRRHVKRPRTAPNGLRESGRAPGAWVGFGRFGVCRQPGFCRASRPRWRRHPAVAEGASGRLVHAGRPWSSFPRRRESTRAEAAGNFHASTLESALLGAHASRPQRAGGPPLSTRAGRPRSQENPLRNGESLHATGWSIRPSAFRMAFQPPVPQYLSIARDSPNSPCPYALRRYRTASAGPALRDSEALSVILPGGRAAGGVDVFAECTLHDRPDETAPRDAPA